MRLRSFLLVVGSVLMGPALAASQTSWYVAPDGRDSNPCTSLRPCATISHASIMVRPGDTVLVAPGTYEGSFQTRASGTSSAYITYRSSERWGARLVQGHSGSAWGNYGSYVDIDGFEVVGNPNSTGVNGIYTQGDHTTIEHNRIHGILPDTCNGIGGSGIQLDSSHDRVIGNYVYQIGPQPGSPLYPCSYVHGIYFLKPYGLAAENIVFEASGYGIHEWHQASDITVVNNTIFNNGFGGVLVGNDGRGNPHQNNNSITDNNIVFANGKFGIHECCTKAYTGLCNLFDNNLLSGNPVNVELQTGSQNNTKITDPMFVHYVGNSSGDYHLQPQSPGIGLGRRTDGSATCGTHVTFPSFDFSGSARPSSAGGNGITVGAYESSSSVSASASHSEQDQRP